MGPWIAQWLMLLSGLTAVGPSVDAIASADASAGPFERAIHETRLEMDGVSIRALCTDGQRSVVLLHDAGSDADGWRPVLERLDGTVGACAYDRRGSGASGPAPGERGWYELVDEVRRIHLALGFERDYVLVGHGLGGLYARLYAADRPDVSALLLVEPSHEDMLDRLQAGLGEVEWEALRHARARVNSDGVTEEAVGRRAGVRRLPAIPVTILTATRRTGVDAGTARFIDQAARQLHASVLRQVPGGRHVPASRSGHDVHLDQPDLVAEEIRRLVRIAGRNDS